MSNAEQHDHGRHHEPPAPRRQPRWLRRLGRFFRRGAEVLDPAEADPRYVGPATNPDTRVEARL